MDTIYYAGAIVITAVIFFSMFKKQIIEQLPRIKTIGPISLGENQKGALEATDPRKEAEDLIRQLDSELVRETEDLIKTELEKRKLTGSDAVPVLIKYFTVVYIEYLFSDIYRTIYGSQINLLDYLNSQGLQSRETLKIFYDIAMSQYGDLYKNYSYDQWLGYLKTQILLREDNGLFAITVRGREFLLYLTRSGLSRNKFG